MLEGIKLTGRNSDPIPCKATDLNSFLKHIKNLPEGPWDQIRYPIELGHFNPRTHSHKGKMDNSAKRKFMKAMKDLTTQNKKRGTPIYSWEIGGGGFRKYEDPNDYAGNGFYYVNLRSESSDQFGKDMSSGKYGPLD